MNFLFFGELIAFGAFMTSGGVGVILGLGYLDVSSIASGSLSSVIPSLVVVPIIFGGGALFINT